MAKNERAKDSHLDKLGIDVNISSRALEADLWAKSMLREVGASLSKASVDNRSMNYVGSIAVHILVESNAIAKPSYAIESITQIALDDISEQLAVTATSNMIRDIRIYFNPDLKLKSTRKGDKR